MSSLFNKRPKTSHEKKLALISARFREKPKKYPDPFEERKFLLFHIGQSGVSKVNASGLGGVHKIILEYYISFLRKITQNEWSLREYGRLNPASIRMLTLRKNTMIVNFKQHRRPPADAMLIDQEQIYLDEQIVYSDCFCFEVVQPTGTNTQMQDNLDSCYGYFRQASDVRRAVPESNLFLLDKSLSDFFLMNKHYPRPPIIVCVLGPSRNCTNLYCHVYVTETIERGLDFVKTVVDYTYGMNENPMVSSTPNLTKLPYVIKTNGPLRNLQRRVSKIPAMKSGHFKQSQLFSSSPYEPPKMPSLPSLAPLSGKNGRSMLFTPNRGVYTSEAITLTPEHLDEIDRNFNQGQSSDSSEHSNQPNDEKQQDYREEKKRKNLDVYGTGPWLAKSTSALLVSPMTTDEFEPLRKRLLDMHIAKEAKVERSRSKRSTSRNQRSRSKSSKSIERDSAQWRTSETCNCQYCDVHDYQPNECAYYEENSPQPVVNNQDTFKVRRSRYFPAKK